jgi:hypothetical protein
VPVAAASPESERVAFPSTLGTVRAVAWLGARRSHALGKSGHFPNLILRPGSIYLFRTGNTITLAGFIRSQRRRSWSRCSSGSDTALSWEL